MLECSILPCLTFSFQFAKYIYMFVNIYWLLWGLMLQLLLMNWSIKETVFNFKVLTIDWKFFLWSVKHLPGWIMFTKNIPLSLLALQALFKVTHWFLNAVRGHRFLSFRGKLMHNKCGSDIYIFSWQHKT